MLPQVEDENSTRKLAETLALAGYTHVGLTIPTGLMQDRVKQLQHLFHEAGIEAATRVDLNSTSRHELLRHLRRFRGSYDIVSVKCANPNVATVACRDRRVDVIFFEPANNRVRFSHSLANMLHGTFEFNLTPVLISKSQGTVLSRTAKEASIAREHGTKIVLSSGCTSLSMVRSPLQIASVASAFGFSPEQSRLGVSEVPFTLIERNVFRRSSEYVEEGVRVVVPRAG